MRLRLKSWLPSSGIGIVEVTVWLRRPAGIEAPRNRPDDCPMPEPVNVGPPKAPSVKLSVAFTGNVAAASRKGQQSRQREGRARREETAHSPYLLRSVLRSAAAEALQLDATRP
jgi:hypothetical protein